MTTKFETQQAGERTQLDGHFQYRGIIRYEDGSSASATEFSDWFTDDAAARAGFREIMEEQGYSVVSVEIGFPSVVTIKRK